MSEISNLRKQIKEYKEKISDINKTKVWLDNALSNLNDSNNYLKSFNSSISSGGLLLNNKNPFEQDINNIRDNISSAKDEVKTCINNIPTQKKKYEKEIRKLEKEIEELQNSNGG